LHIGFFISSYAIVEIHITMMLAKATGIDKLQSFDLLTRGMDLRVKIERLRRACELGPHKIGPNLDARLTVVDGVMRPLRNKLAHQAAALSPDKMTISLVSLAAWPDFLTARHPDQEISERIETLELFEYAAWLLVFNKDLSGTLKTLARTGIFEIEHPLTPLPPGSKQSPDQPKSAATPSKRERKRARKGQPLRGKGKE
jgi:hypothetical protein